MGISDDIKKKEKKVTIDHKSNDSSDELLIDREIIELPEHLDSANDDSSQKADPDDSVVEHSLRNDFFEQKNHPKNKNKNRIKKPFWPVLLATIAVLGLIVFAAVRNAELIRQKVFGNSKTTSSEEKNREISDQDLVNSSTVENLNQTGSQSTESTTTDSQTTTETPAVLAPVDKSSFTIRVSNGNGISGSAYQVTKILKAAGFNVVSTGNASSYNSKTTIVYYKPTKNREAAEVMSALSGRTVSVEESATLSSYDVLVVVGAK